MHIFLNKFTDISLIGNIFLIRRDVEENVVSKMQIEKVKIKWKLNVNETACSGWILLIHLGRYVSGYVYRYNYHPMR